MIKMLVIDLDETLLHTDKTISAFSEEVLKKARAAGIRVVLATARPVRTVKYYLTLIECDAVICHNGAVTIQDGERLGQRYLVPISEAEKILTALQNRNPHRKLSIEINDRIYANFDVTLFWGKTDRDKELLKASSIQTDFSDLPDSDADKVLIELYSEKEYDEILSLLSADLYAELSDGGKLCLVMNRKAKKLNAIKYLAKKWKISTAQIAAFGDDRNDIEMLKHCGTGVAMKNAINEVLSVADAVTDTNDDDGVAKYILNYILSM